MDLDVKHLRLVAGIADCGSMTGAASRLHLTQRGKRAASSQLSDFQLTVTSHQSPVTSHQ
jgi:DNA-binding transcriptional LysR family regulator